MVRYRIVGPKRIAAVIAQIGQESGQLRFVKEIWGPTKVQVRYEGRADLSNNLPSDGSRFRDLGLVQITGRANYIMCGELLEKPQHAACQHYGFGLPEESTLWSTRTSSTHLGLSFLRTRRQYFLPVFRPHARRLASARHRAAHQPAAVIARRSCPPIASRDDIRKVCCPDAYQERSLSIYRIRANSLWAELLDTLLGCDCFPSCIDRVSAFALGHVRPFGVATLPLGKTATGHGLFFQT